MSAVRTTLSKFAAAAGLSLCIAAPAVAADPSNWDAVLSEAKGQTVYFHAWGGEQSINDYISWAGERIEELYGVRLVQVKVDDTANVVSQILNEKAAGKEHGGSVDLVWINGENFASMKQSELLASEGWADKLPNWKYVDVAGKPTVTHDFTVATDGLESPWGMAKLVFMYDTKTVAAPPKSMAELASYAKANPGRLTYPQPPNFLGTTFLKQALYAFIDDPVKLQSPVRYARFEKDTEALFAFLDELHPYLWRQGRAFPQSVADMRQMLADGEIDISFTFNPGDASSAIASGQLPDSIRSFVLDGGTIGNSHFVAIPFNANAMAGALVTANFLLSPEAQARKQDPGVWGDPTVLDVSALPDGDKARFAELKLGVATLTPDALGPVLLEPHSSWVAALETAWARKYGAQ